VDKEQFINNIGRILPSLMTKKAQITPHQQRMGNIAGSGFRRSTAGGPSAEGLESLGTMFQDPRGAASMGQFFHGNPMAAGSLAQREFLRYRARSGDESAINALAALDRAGGLGWGGRRRAENMANIMEYAPTGNIMSRALGPWSGFAALGGVAPYASDPGESLLYAKYNPIPALTGGIQMGSELIPSAISGISRRLGFKGAQRFGETLAKYTTPKLVRNAVRGMPILDPLDLAEFLILPAYESARAADTLGTDDPLGKARRAQVWENMTRQDVARKLGARKAGREGEAKIRNLINRIGNITVMGRRLGSVGPMKGLQEGIESLYGSVLPDAVGGTLRHMMYAHHPLIAFPAHAAREAFDTAAYVAAAQERVNQMSQNMQEQLKSDRGQKMMENLKRGKSLLARRRYANYKNILREQQTRPQFSAKVMLDRLLGRG